MASNSSSAGNLSVAGTVATIVEEQTDHGLNTIEHVILIVGVLAFLAVLFVMRKPLVRTLTPVFRNLCCNCSGALFKRCLKRYCCGCCGHASGLYELAQASHTLGVTVVGVKDIAKRMNFYVEIWTEPQESASRITRTQFQVSGEVAINERIELDWFGDEEWVVVQVVAYPGVGKEKPLGEVRVNQKAIAKYAKEAASDPHNQAAGARLLGVKQLEEWMVKLRRRRANTQAPQNVLFSWGLSKAQEKVGLGIALGEEETWEVQQKNKRLEAEIAMLKSNQGSNAQRSAMSTKMDDVEAVMEFQPVIMNIVLKFDLQPRQSPGAFNSNLFKQSSFHETQTGYSQHALH